MFLPTTQHSGFEVFCAAQPPESVATQHGVDLQSRRAFSFKAKGAASGQDATPFRSAAGQSAVQPRNNSFGNFTNRLRRSLISSAPGREASAALGTSPFPFQPPSFIHINHAHFAVSRLVQSVAGNELSGGLFSCARKSFAAGQK